MHQIRFRLGLHPRPRWGSLQPSQSPDTLAVFKGPPRNVVLVILTLSQNIVPARAWQIQMIDM